MTNHLNSFLNRIGRNYIKDWYSIRDIQDWMLEEIYRKRKTFPIWRKKVLFSFTSWIKNKTKKGPSNDIAGFSEYFYRKMDWLFRYYFQKMFNGFNENQLQLVGIEGHAKSQFSDLFFEYKYHLTEMEIASFKHFKEEFEHPDHYHRIISYIFNLVIMVFGKLIKDILKKDIQITMLCAEVKITYTGEEYIHFIIVSRKLDVAFLKTYLYSLIYHFAEVFPNVNKGLLAQLKKKNDEIYPIALAEYPKSRRTISTVLFTLQKKCQLLEEITPVLDILNFIASRVEDSIYDTIPIVQEIIEEKIILNKDPELIDDIVEIFEFLNSNASLFSTFQANNRANMQRQYQLFFFYAQYFCFGGLENMENSTTFNFPAIIQQTIEIEQFSERFPNITMETFTNFIFQGLSLPTSKAMDIVFHYIYGQSVKEVNETFFECFLHSLNIKFHSKLQEIRDRNPRFQIDFDEIVHIILVILFNLTDKIFLAKKPEDVQDNFRDKISRYTPQKITLRVLELNIFKDIPLSDNNWQDYFLSRNKKFVRHFFQRYFEIPDSYFFSNKRLLKINIMYERGLLPSAKFLEEWIIAFLLQKFYIFQKEVTDSLPKHYETQDITEKLHRLFLKDIKDEQIQKDLKEIVEFFAKIW
ncbi:hypothetical protein NEF87_001406 [Candidatus Lokiarchaeum ossiferum]|uniref:Uncharacterized protein n=1 Tax=Candidatus Lokiarchaeum ossiferum TaxID=2951803 RepID=A0ABY6HRD2_9ARCH|nr:hypothetical protein NEF87_001406 [Candidatus Lokiarchaeum sp. B-35]